MDVGKSIYSGASLDASLTIDSNAKNFRKSEQSSSNKVSLSKKKIFDQKIKLLTKRLVGHVKATGRFILEGEQALWLNSNEYMKCALSVLAQSERRESESNLRVAFIVGEAHILSTLPEIARKANVIIIDDISVELIDYIKKILAILSSSKSIDEFKERFLEDLELLPEVTFRTELVGVYSLGISELTGIDVDGMPLHKITFKNKDAYFTCDEDSSILGEFCFYEKKEGVWTPMRHKIPECAKQFVQHQVLESGSRWCQDNLGDFYFLSSEKRFNMCREALHKLHVMFANVDILNAEEMSSFSADLVDSEATVSLCNVSNVEDYDERNQMRISLKALPFEENCLFFHSSKNVSDLETRAVEGYAAFLKDAGYIKKSGSLE